MGHNSHLGDKEGERDADGDGELGDEDASVVGVPRGNSVPNKAPNQAPNCIDLSRN